MAEVLGGAAFTLFILLIVAGFVFWIRILLDCVRNEPDTGNDKVVWVIIIVFTQIIGALMYYYVRRRPRRFAQWQKRASSAQ